MVKSREAGNERIITRMNPEKRKQQILDSAKRLFASRGYYQTQISDIQKASSVARGTIYHYFKSKDDIFVTILDNLFIDWKNALASNPDTDSEEYKSGLKFFTYKIRNSFKFFVNDPDYFNILLKIGLGLGGNFDIEDFDILISRFDHQILELAKGYLKAGIKMKKVKPDIDVELTANLIGGAFMRMAYFYGLAKKKDDTPDIDLLSEKFVNVFSFGYYLE